MASEKAWVIVGEFGLYNGLQFTRRDAIDVYVRAKIGDPDSYKAAWEKLRTQGDRAVRATITWNEPVGRKAKK